MRSARGSWRMAVNPPTAAAPSPAGPRRTRGPHANHAIICDATGIIDPSERLGEIITRPADSHSALAVQHRLHHDADVLESIGPGHEATKPLEPEAAAPSVDADLGDQIARMTARLDAHQVQRQDRTLGRRLSR